METVLHEARTDGLHLSTTGQCEDISRQYRKLDSVFVSVSDQMT